MSRNKLNKNLENFDDPIVATFNRPRRGIKENDFNYARHLPEVTTINRLDKIPKNRKEPGSQLLSTKGLIWTFILLIVTLLLYDVVKHSVNVDFQALKTELTHKVHNQSEAITAIFDTLDRIENDEPVVSIVNFIGSSGVGKTFIANIIKRHFQPSLYETRGPFNSNKAQNMVSAIEQSRYKYNLVIIDDLTVKDVDELLNFVKKLPDDVLVLVILIFTIQETDDFFIHKIHYDHIRTIENKCTTAGIGHEVAKFHEFSKDEARAWVVKQLVKKQIDVGLHSKIVESVLDNQNVKYQGLKGLSSKLNLEL